MRDYLAGTTGDLDLVDVQGRAARDVRASAFPTACARTRSCRRPSSPRPPRRADGEHDEPLTAAEIVERGLLTAAAVARGVGEGARAVRARARDRGRARPDPGRHQIRVRPRPRRPTSCSPTRSTRPTAAATGSPRPMPRRFAAGEPPDSFDKDFVRRWVAARCDPYRDPIPPIPREIIAEAARGLYQRLRDASPARAFAAARAGQAGARPHPRQSAALFLSGAGGRASRCRLVRVYVMGLRRGATVPRRRPRAVRRGATASL